MGVEGVPGPVLGPQRRDLGRPVGARVGSWRMMGGWERGIPGVLGIGGEGGAPVKNWGLSNQGGLVEAGIRCEDLEELGAGSRTCGAADLRAEDLEAAGAGAEEPEDADLGAEELEVAEAGAEELEAVGLGGKRGAGREDAETRPLKVVPGSLRIHWRPWPCPCP